MTKGAGRSPAFARALFARCELHPDYLGNESRWHAQQKLTAAATPTEVPPIVLRRGVRLTVRTTDPARKPVKGAVVIWGNDPYSSIRDTAVVTDESGSCRLPGFGEGPMRVTVVAKGWMPDSRMVQLKRQMDPLEFHLKPGRKLRVRFVDGSGAAVPEVGAWVKKWRGVEEVHSNVNGQIKIEIPGKADDKGIYEWDWAPDDAVSFRFGKRGFAGIEQSITADGTEHVLTINHVLQITGTVRDAVTGKEINEFLVLPLLHFRPDFPIVDRREAREEKNGVLAMQFDRMDIEHGLQIEAPGYETFRTTERYRIGSPGVVLDVRLKPAAHYRGTVVGPDGRPVKGAHVSVSSRLEQLNDGLSERQENVNNNHRVHTDSEGDFEIAAQLDRYDLVVIAPEGFAEVNRRADQIPGEIRLARWASVSGRLVQSGKPVAECDIFLRPIRLSGGDEPHNFSSLTTKTASDGSFAFPRVPPVPCSVEAFLHWGAKSPLTSSRSVPLSPAPGEKLHVELGGGGIDVTGQLVAENQPPGFDYHFGLNYLVARRPGIEPPEFLAGKGFDWKRGWNDSWLHSPEGRTYLVTLNNWFVKPEPDGRFRLSGVEPGAYDFAVNLYGTTEGCLVHPIATGVAHFTVKPGETQLDLGKVSISSFTLPKVGDAAADFEFTAPDGSKSRLSTLRGKHILIDFWATWCGPCVAKLDEVERLRKQFGADDRLVVVGANLDAETARAREFLKSKPLPWQHALLGDWSSTDVPRHYAVSTVPAYVLIDPAGRILATEYSLEAIESKLKMLGEKQPMAAKK
jgi:thiol-disulfide isomerase/thioredoxin